MANYFYVKSGFGTRTTGGGDPTPRTGAFSAMAAGDVYATWEAAVLDGADADESYICSSHLHDHDYVTSKTIAFTGTNVNVVMTSVDDANCENYLRGATERTSGAGSTLAFSGAINIYRRGLEVFCDAGLSIVQNSTGSHSDWQDCGLTLTGSGRFTGGTVDSTVATCRDCDLLVAYTDSTLTGFGTTRNGGSIIVEGGTFSCPNISVLNLDQAAATGGGAIVIYRGIDFIDVKPSNLSIIAYTYGTRDITVSRFQGLSVPATTVFNTTTPTQSNHLVEATGCADDDSSEYQYYIATYKGTIEATSSVYRDNSAAYQRTGQKVSYRIDTDARALPGAEAVFDVPIRPIDLTTSSIVRLYLVCANTLTDVDFRVEVYYKTSTDTSLVGHQLSTNFYDTLITGTELTANTESWTGVTTENKYQIDLDTSSIAGANGLVYARVYVSKPSETIFVCSTVEGV